MTNNGHEEKTEKIRIRSKKTGGQEEKKAKGLFQHLEGHPFVFFLFF